jgi:CYTH domain-containing protein
MPPLEIERTYLLARLPDLPPSCTQLRIEQGYLPDPEPRGDEQILEGRIRRTVYPDGRVKCTHTIKRGTGLVRTEEEREIDVAEFEQHWSATEGRRLRKIRHKVPVGARTWEVDQFLDVELVMAEIELESAEEQVELPAWLADCVLEDVTETPAYRNFNLALRLGRGEGLPPREAAE